MKKLFLIAVMAVISLSASAQKMRHDAGSITIQPMIGISTGYLRGEEKIGSTTVKYENDEARTGLGIGAEAEYYTTTPWLSVSAAVLYQQQGWDMKSSPTSKIDFINIPVLANFYVGKGFALKIGLQPGFLVKAEEDGVSVKDDYNTFNLSLPVGLSYEFKNGITLDLRGAAAITKLNKKSGALKKYNDGGILTVGYKFSLQ